MVGHSFGGLIAQELLANRVVAAAVAIDPAAIKGVKALPFAQLKSAFPVLGNPANLHRTVSLTPKQVHYAFGNTLTEEESNALHDAWTIHGAGLPLFQDAAANFFPHSPAKVDTHLADRGPLLLTSGTEDHTVPIKVTKEVVAMYAKGPADTEFHVFEGKGHSLTIDNGWKEVAEVTLNWLAAKGFDTATPAGRLITVEHMAQEHDRSTKFTMKVEHNDHHSGHHSQRRHWPTDGRLPDQGRLPGACLGPQG